MQPVKAEFIKKKTKFYLCSNFTILQIAEHLSRLMTKPTKWPVCQAKIQISLGICPVWSESSLCAQLVGKDPRQVRLIRLGGCHFVGFVMRWFICFSMQASCQIHSRHYFYITDYVDRLMDEVMLRRREFRSYRQCKNDLEPVIQSTPKPVSARYDPIDKQAVVSAHKSRFGKNLLG